jgi:hypothetical protein
MTSRPLAAVHDEYRQMRELMDELPADSSQSPEGMRARAAELREEAEACRIKGEREAALALADRYECAATSRLSAAAS